MRWDCLQTVCCMSCVPCVVYQDLRLAADLDSLAPLGAEDEQSQPGSSQNHSSVGLGTFGAKSCILKKELSL